MDIGITKAECERILRKANKILNLWIEKELPFTREHLLEPKQQLQDAFMTKLLEKCPDTPIFQQALEGLHVKKAIDQMENLSIQDRKRLEKNKINYSGQEALQISEAIMKRYAACMASNELTHDEKMAELKIFTDQAAMLHYGARRAHEASFLQSDKKVAGEHELAPFKMFQLYLYPSFQYNQDGRTKLEFDVDITVDETNLKLEQKLILKEIKKIIKTLSVDELDALYILDILFLKIISILNYSQFETNQNIDFDTLESWGKIGLWLIERSTQVPSQQWERKMIKPFVQHVQKITTPYVALIYANIAYFLAMSGAPEKIFSQNLLEIADFLKEKIVKTSQNCQTFQLIDTISLCAQAKNALDNKDIEGFTICLGKALEIDYRYTSSLFNMLYLAGKHFSEVEPDKTQQYFTKALTLISTANDREASLEKELMAEIEKYVSEYKAKKLIDLQAEIIKEFPNKCGVSISGPRLNIFLYLEKVPKNQITLSSDEAITDLKKYDKVAIKDKVVTGFRFYSCSENNQAVINAIRKLIQQIDKALDLECSRLAMQPQQKSPLLLEPVTSKPKLTSQPAPPAKKGPKKKTQGAAGGAKNNIQPTVASKSPLIVKKPAEQYGFNLEGYSRVAPLFLSKANQAMNKPKIIVAWDDKKSTALDDETISKFKKLFHPNGVVQAREVNDSGFKVSIGPKGDLIVRGKLKGAGGSTRVYFKPKERIMTEDGNEVTLCVLKKKMNK